MESFAAVLQRHGLELRKAESGTLQVSTGRLCNQSCRHCHLDAGPDRTEVMDRRTMEDVIAYAGRSRFDCIDITGGAPEMLPGIEDLLQGLSKHCRRLMFRTNLTALAGREREELIELCRELRVALVASFTSTSSSQTDSQRGEGVWESSLHSLRELNRRGFGMAGTGLELNLVVNPAGAFLPADQCQMEKKYKSDLERRWGITFNNLFSFANVPLGRFRKWLLHSGNYGQYLGKLAGHFNPHTIPGLMCRTLVTVSWDGYLYDCDFNLAADLPLGKEKIHVTGLSAPPSSDSPIAVGDHCFACTAGSGFT